MGRQWLPTDRITKPLGVCYGFATVFNLIFWLPQFWGKGIVTIGLSLSLTVFAVHRMFQMDRRADGIGLAVGCIMC